VIPPSVSLIDDIAFARCFGLETVTFEGCVDEIDEDSFKDTTLKAIYVPEGKVDHYKKALPPDLHPIIVEQSKKEEK